MHFMKKTDINMSMLKKDKIKDGFGQIEGTD